jgi:glycosyltransferase involved in cell wall biosynthesis
MMRSEAKGLLGAALPADWLRDAGRINRHQPWLLIAEGFHQRGGMDKANAGLARFLCSRNIPVCLVAYSIDREFTDNSTVAVIRAISGDRTGFLRRFSLARLAKITAFNLTRHFPDLRVVANGINCNCRDINWVHWIHHRWQPQTCAAPLWFKFKQRLESSLSTHIERKAFRPTRLLVANSSRTKRDLVDLLGIKPERIETIYPGSDSNWKTHTPHQRTAARAWLEIPPERPVVAFVGALGYDARKGFDLLWRAWQKLCGLPQWDADLVVAGGGRAAPKWRRVVSQSGLSGRVRFLGFTSRIADVLAASDLLVSPVRYESYGLNVQEALCFGVPAIVSASAGVAERFSGNSVGLLLPDPENISDLIMKMLLWRRDIVGCKRSIEPTAQLLRAYTWSDMAARIVETADRPMLRNAAAG